MMTIEKCCHNCVHRDKPSIEYPCNLCDDGRYEYFQPRSTPPEQPTKPPMPPVNPPKDEEINHPRRYAGGKYECIDIMLDVFGKEAVKDFCLLNAFKYIWRQEKKGGVEDVKKAVCYLNKYIELSDSHENV